MKEQICQRIQEHAAWMQYQIIDTSMEKFQNSPGLMNWAKRQNLKNASRLYAEVGSINELVNEIQRQGTALQKEISDKERKLKELEKFFDLNTGNKSTSPRKKGNQRNLGM